MQEETYATRTEANPSPPDSGPARTRAAGRYAAIPCSPRRSPPAPGQVDVEVVPVLCPAVLCGQRRLAVLVTGGDGLGGAMAGHIMLGLREAASSIP